MSCTVLRRMGADLGATARCDAHEPAQPASVVLLRLIGLSANPLLVNFAVRYGDNAPTLPSAMATSSFNAGTAVGT